MRTAEAFHLLTESHSVDALPSIIRALGIAREPVAAARGVERTLAHCGANRVVIAEGPGALRALIAEIDGAAPLREVATTIARWLACTAPTSRWLLALARRDGAESALALWHANDAAPRVVALVVEPARVRASDAETLCAMVAAAANADDDLHARWLALLGREALSRRFYRRLERGVHALGGSASGGAPTSVRDELALLHVSRLLFLAFLEAKGWLDGNHRFLRDGLDACGVTGGGYHARVLRPLFFGTLNTPMSRRAAAARAFGRVPFLNGGLFAPTPTERRHRSMRFDDDALAAIVIDLLGRHRFTAREDDAAFSDSAVDPEMLGRAFESLMGAGDRQRTGAFYTPQTLVVHATREALGATLATDCATCDVTALLAGHPLDERATAALRRRLTALRVLDPACGSGAFVVHALERIAALLVACGDARPIAAIRRDVLARSVFGVDINPTAVWLCELRLWLSVVVESDEPDPMRVAPLPNLDHQIRVGDALAASAWTRGWGGDPWALAGGAIAHERSADSLRARYGRASGRRKVTLGAALDRAERGAAIAAVERALTARRTERAELISAARGRDLFGARRGSAPPERRRLTELRDECRALAARRRGLMRGAALPFGFAWHFPDLAARGGCDIVIGNPPWVRPHALGTAERHTLRATYETCRDAAWAPGASAARAGRGFGGQADLAAPFVERSLALARPGGVVSLLVPSKLWRALAGGGVRRLLLRESHVRLVEDWSEAPALFDAAVYPSLVVVQRGALSVERGAPADEITVRVHDSRGASSWTTGPGSLALDATPGSPWLLARPPVRDALAQLQSVGVPLGEAELGRILLGVKCGCNGAFVVRVVRACGDVADVDGVWPDGSMRYGRVERALLRPIVRGETLHVDGDEHVLWAYDERGRPLRTLPPNAAAWFAPWRARLAARSDARRAGVPWTLFRTAAAECREPRIVWSDVATALRPRLLAAGDPTVPLNSCYALACRDADAAALMALLASPVADAWCGALAEPARGGFRRHLAWTLALMPVPRDWPRARAVLERDASPDGLALAYGVERRVIEELRAVY